MRDTTNWNAPFPPKGKFFEILGQDIICQVNNCQNVGLAFCDQKFNTFMSKNKFVGCGRVLCKDHIEMHHNQNGVWFYHCKYRKSDRNAAGNPFPKNKTDCGNYI